MTDSTGSDEDRWREQWVTELARLELDLQTAERMLVESDIALHPWQPPQMRIPLPEDLVDRAQELHRRQAEVVVKMMQRLTANRQQRELANRLESGKAPRSAYLDVSA